MLKEQGNGDILLKNDNKNRFEVFRALTQAGSRGIGFHKLAELALTHTAELVGLKAAALIVWDKDFQPVFSVTHADEESDKDRLLSLEKDMYDKFRRDRQLVSAYLSFGGETTIHSFTLPLKYQDNTFGAVIGLQEGERTIISEESFLETLASVVGLYYTASSGGVRGSDLASMEKRLEQERLSGILDTAVTVNHEVNNPLQAIIASVQLLFINTKDMDKELEAKLKVIEEAAMKIGSVTKRLTQVTDPTAKVYLDGTNMIPLPEDENKDEQ